MTKRQQEHVERLRRLKQFVDAQLSRASGEDEAAQRVRLDRAVRRVVALQIEQRNAHADSLDPRRIKRALRATLRRQLGRAVKAERSHR